MFFAVVWAIAVGLGPNSSWADDTHVSQHHGAPTASVPVRAVRRNTVSVELGLNTLVGAGVQFSRSLTPHLNVETGLGLSFQSVKTGLRLRANFSRADFTPFVAAGIMVGSGTPGTQRTCDRGNAIDYKVLLSPFAQGTLGCAWTTRSGFSMLAGLGWAQLLRRSNVVVTRGTPTANQMERLTFSAGSGPTGALAMGYSF